MRRRRILIASEVMKKLLFQSERASAHVLGRGGIRRTWLRGRENVAKR
jgi:hypothetical protein